MNQGYGTCAAGSSPNLVACRVLSHEQILRDVQGGG
jgi:hypothetical protein